MLFNHLRLTEFDECNTKTYTRETIGQFLEPFITFNWKRIRFGIYSYSHKSQKAFVIVLCFILIILVSTTNKAREEQAEQKSRRNKLRNHVLKIKQHRFSGPALYCPLP